MSKRYRSNISGGNSVFTAFVFPSVHTVSRPLLCINVLLRRCAAPKTQVCSSNVNLTNILQRANIGWSVTYWRHFCFWNKNKKNQTGNKSILINWIILFKKLSRIKVKIRWRASHFIIVRTYCIRKLGTF